MNEETPKLHPKDAEFIHRENLKRYREALLRTLEHPEAKDDEIYIANASPNATDTDTYGGWKHPRFGKKAFGAEGQPVDNAIPVFIPKSQVLSRWRIEDENEVHSVETDLEEAIRFADELADEEDEFEI